jgi:hypothetical protein
MCDDILPPGPRCRANFALFTIVTSVITLPLSYYALGNPWRGTLYRLWRADHPALGERIEFSNHYHPWRAVRSLR